MAQTGGPRTTRTSEDYVMGEDLGRASLKPEAQDDSTCQFPSGTFRTQMFLTRATLKYSSFHEVLRSQGYAFKGFQYSGKIKLLLSLLGLQSEMDQDKVTEN